jgi:hypothetical protein
MWLNFAFASRFKVYASHSHDCQLGKLTADVIAIPGDVVFARSER